MELISMVAFIKEQNEKNQGDYQGKEAEDLLLKLYNEIFNYANLLSQPLTLGMFVPCVDNVPYESYHTYSINNNTICEPYEGLFEIYANTKRSGWKYLDPDKTRYYDAVAYKIAKEKYQQAKENVLFEGFEYSGHSERCFILSYKDMPYWIESNDTIEGLIENFTEPLTLKE